MFDRAIIQFGYLLRHLGYPFRREAKTAQEFVEMVRFNKCSIVKVGAYVTQRTRVQRSRYPHILPPTVAFEYGLRLTGRTPGGRTIMCNEWLGEHFGQEPTDVQDVFLLAEQRIRELQPMLPGVSFQLSEGETALRKVRSH